MATESAAQEGIAVSDEESCVEEEEEEEEQSTCCTLLWDSRPEQTNKYTIRTAAAYVQLFICHKSTWQITQCICSGAAYGVYQFK